MPSKKLRKKLKLGDVFGGLTGRAVKALKGNIKPKGSKKTRKQLLDEI